MHLSSRVIGARVGQTLEVRNSDALQHNVHSLSDGRNSFNADQSNVGAAGKFRMNVEEIMLRLKCDVHSWMTGYIGVVNHPYFAVSIDTGAFEIAKVPPEPLQFRPGMSGMDRSHRR